MKILRILVLGSVMLLPAIWGCNKSANLTTSDSGWTIDEEIASLESAAKPNVQAPAPSPLVTVAVGETNLEFWPFTGTNFTSDGHDPINLIFFGMADPRDIREALISLDGDRIAYELPPFAPFNSTWTDAIGTIQASYGTGVGWTGGAIQLACGDYETLRFHLRLFKIGNWTVANAHFEAGIPGTTEHQVVSWELAEQFVIVDFIRSGLLHPDIPMIPTQQINPSPFKAIPAMIYNGLPPELTDMMDYPPGPVTEDVPIASDGHAIILNLVDRIAWQPDVRYQDFVIDYNQVVPKPFCSTGPADFVKVEGPVHLSQTVRLNPAGVYEMSFHAKGDLIVFPADPFTGESLGDTLAAKAREIYAVHFTDSFSLASSLLYQKIEPPNAPGAGRLFTLFRVNSNGLTLSHSDTDCAP
jgi:hypothetical protein